MQPKKHNHEYINKLTNDKWTSPDLLIERDHVQRVDLVHQLGQVPLGAAAGLQALQGLPCVHGVLHCLAGGPYLLLLCHEFLVELLDLIQEIWRRGEREGYEVWWWGWCVYWRFYTVKYADFCLFSRHGPGVYTALGKLPAWASTPIYPPGPYTHWWFGSHSEGFRGSMSGIPGRGGGLG